MNEIKKEEKAVKHNPLTWDKFKDITILALIAFAIKIFQSNMEDMNHSVVELNSKVGIMVARTQINESEIMILRSNLREIELKVYSNDSKK